MKQNSKLVWEGSFFNKMIKKTFLIYWSSPSWSISTFKPSGINWWKPKCTGSEMRHYLQIQLKNIRIHSILTWRLLTYKEFVLTEVNLNKGCQLKNVLTGPTTAANISEKSRNSKKLKKYDPLLKMKKWVIILQLFWIPAPFRDIGHCCLSSWDIFKFTPFTVYIFSQ